MKLRLFVFISIFLLVVSCSKKEEIYSPSKKIDPYLIYKEGCGRQKTLDSIWQ